MNPRKKQILLVVGVILAIFDILSDIFLAMDYCLTDNPWWCVLTWTFFAVPALLGLFSLFLCFCVLEDGKDDIFKRKNSLLEDMERF